ncbi:MAG: hypothetical protein QG657_4324, partial [Acidobacteriota bacterium]|nr:hypothetical protein [Acidobacteriota bacterium]
RGILPAQNLSNIGDLVYTLKRSDKNVEDITDTERERLYLSIFSIFIEMEKGGVLLNYLKDAFEKICTDIQLTIAEFSWVKLWSGDIPIESESLKVIRKKLENAKCDLYNSYSIYLNWFENDTKLLHLNENLKKEVYTGNLESWPAIQWVKLIDLIKNKNPMWATMIASIENRLFRDRDEGDKYAVLWLERISFLRVVQAISEKSTIGLNTILKYVKNSLRYAMEANAPEATAIEEFINLLEAGGLMKYEVNDKILNQLKLLGLTKESIENF